MSCAVNLKVKCFLLLQFRATHLHIADDHHLRLCQTTFYIIEMHSTVVGYKTNAHFRFVLALIHRQMLQHLLDLRAQ